jgi:hypothetical protein
VAIPSDEVAPIRLFRGDRYSISISGGNITVAADHPCTAQLAGTIQRCTNPSVADLIKQLNEQTSSAALQQMHAGRRPRLFRAILRSITRFFNSYFAQREIRNGWIGLQRSLLESFFVWIEETKLYQVAAEFVHHDADAAADLQTPASNLRLCAPTGDIAAEVKAA